MIAVNRKSSSKHTKPRLEWAKPPALLGAVKGALALCAAILCALCFTLPTAAFAQDNGYGPPRDRAVEGDVAAAPLTDQETANLVAFARIYTVARWFHPSDAALRADWDALAIEAVPGVLAAQNPDALAEVLREIFAPIVEDLEIASSPLAPFANNQATSARWRWWHYGFAGINRATYAKSRAQMTSLGRGPVFAENVPPGLYVRFPLTATVNREETPETEVQTQFAGKPEGWVPAGFDRTTRIASTIIAWGILDQFYPYWDVVDVDWGAKLIVQLQRAASAEDDMAFHQALRLMMHEIEDGHAAVAYRASNPAIAPIVLERVDNQTIVVWAEPGSGIDPGDIVAAIDGEPA